MQSFIGIAIGYTPTLSNIRYSNPLTPSPPKSQETSFLKPPLLKKSLLLPTCHNELLRVGKLKHPQ